MMLVPISPKPSQAVTVQLAGQDCRITVYTRETGLYLDLVVNNVPAVTGRICEDRTRLVRDAYLGFAGDLVFADTQGFSDPVADGLGGQFRLVYLEAGE